MNVEERSRGQVWKRRQKQFKACRLRESGRKGRCDITSTHPQRERKGHVINLGGGRAAHYTRVTGTNNRLLSKCAAQTPRSAPLLFTNKDACVNKSTRSTRHTTMSPQIEN